MITYMVLQCIENYGFQSVSLTYTFSYHFIFLIFLFFYLYVCLFRTIISLYFYLSNIPFCVCAYLDHFY